MCGMDEDAKREPRDQAEEGETLEALDEALAELERGEGRPIDQALPALRDRLGIGNAPETT